MSQLVGVHLVLHSHFTGVLKMTGDLAPVLLPKLNKLISEKTFILEFVLEFFDNDYHLQGRRSERFYQHPD